MKVDTRDTIQVEQRQKQAGNSRGRPKVTCGDNGGVSRQSRMPCKRAPAKGRKWCKYHGGHAPQGIGHYNYHGKGKSKYLPVNLVGQYQAFIKNPELVTLREEIATAEMKICRLLSQLQGKSGTRWDSLQDTYRALVDAIRSGDADRLRVALTAHGQIVDEANHDNYLWDRITEANEAKMRLVVAERKYLIDSDEMLTPDRLTIIMAELLHVTKSCIDNPKIPRSELAGAIGDGVYALMNRRPVGENDDVAVGQHRENGYAHPVDGQAEEPPKPEEPGPNDAH